MPLHRTSPTRPRLSALPRSGLVALLLAALACLPVRPARAASGPDPSDRIQAEIPGTNMTHDEFRARAYAELMAIALNAHAYFAVNNQFPATYADLEGSDAWNLDVANIFGGGRVQAIPFSPGPRDYTTDPPALFPLPGNVDADSPEASGQAPLKASGNIQDGLTLDAHALSEQMMAAAQDSSARVNPKAVQPQSAGDVFYYAKDGMLQLVLYAPDRTYMEYVAFVPNQDMLANLNIKSGGRSFPADLYANEVLYYLERMLPQHYNFVRFMAGAQPLPEPELQRKSAQERLDMASDIGVTVFNPYTKQNAQVASKTPQPGELAAGDPAEPTPVRLALRSGELVSFEQLSAGEATAPAAGNAATPRVPAKPTPPSGPPPLGGRQVH
jgi:hypothetical protein